MNLYDLIHNRKKLIISKEPDFFVEMAKIASTFGFNHFCSNEKYIFILSKYYTLGANFNPKN